MLESEEIKIGFIFLELLTNKIKVVCQLVILFGNREEVVAADRLNDTVGFGNKLLELLSVITDETIGVKTRALEKKLVRNENLPY